MVEVIFKDDEHVKLDAKGQLNIHENDISKSFRKLMDGRYLNLNEFIPMSMLDGSLILKLHITSFENLKDGNEQLTYGIIEKESVINATVVAKQRKDVKIQTDKVQEK